MESLEIQGALKIFDISLLFRFSSPTWETNRAQRLKTEYKQRRPEIALDAVLWVGTMLERLAAPQREIDYSSTKFSGIIMSTVAVKVQHRKALDECHTGHWPQARLLWTP